MLNPIHFEVAIFGLEGCGKTSFIRRSQGLLPPFIHTTTTSFEPTDISFNIISSKTYNEGYLPTNRNINIRVWDTIPLIRDGNTVMQYSSEYIAQKTKALKNVSACIVLHEGLGYPLPFKHKRLKHFMESYDGLKVSSYTKTDVYDYASAYPQYTDMHECSALNNTGIKSVWLDLIRKLVNDSTLDFFNEAYNTYETNDTKLRLSNIS